MTIHNKDGFKVHLWEQPEASKITDGTVSELPWERLKPMLEHSFDLRHSETIEEIQPTANGIRIKIGKR